MSITNWATDAYGTDSPGVWGLTPRPKYIFSVFITIGNEASPILFERISNVQLPDYSYDTQIVNQYNRKRVIQNKINYGTLQIQLYDTQDNAFSNLLSRYNVNYFNSGKGTLESSSPSDIIDPAIAPSFASGAGFNPAGTSNSKYYIPEIKVIQHGHTHERIYDCKNCFITNVQLDLLDYSDSNPSMWSATFQPEVVYFNSIKK